jgi:hypothetical protein
VQVCGEGSEREAEKVTLVEKCKARGVKSARALWRGGKRVGIRKHVEHDWEKVALRASEGWANQRSHRDQPSRPRKHCWVQVKMR